MTWLSHPIRSPRPLLSIPSSKKVSALQVSDATQRSLITSPAGDAIVRELDMSKITLRLVQKEDKKGGEQSAENVYAKLVGDTLQVLQKCLVSQRTPTIKREFRDNTQ